VSQPEAAGGPEKPTGGPDRGILKRGVLTAWTVFIWIFRSPTMLMLLVGGSLGYWGGWQAGKAAVLPAVLKAERALADYQIATAEALRQAAERQVTIRDEVRQEFQDEQIKLDAMGRRLSDVSRGVRLCESVVGGLPVPGTTAGAGAEGDAGQPAEAGQVLAELAASIAATCDRNGAQLNALIDWLERTREPNS